MWNKVMQNSNLRLKLWVKSNFDKIRCNELYRLHSFKVMAYHYHRKWKHNFEENEENYLLPTHFLYYLLTSAWRNINSLFKYRVFHLKFCNFKWLYHKSGTYLVKPKCVREAVVFWFLKMLTFFSYLFRIFRKNRL